MESIFGGSSHSEDNEWISFSDLMAVLMVMFLFIAVIYFKRSNVEILREEQAAILLERKKLEQDIDNFKDKLTALELEKTIIDNKLEQAREALRTENESAERAKKLAEDAQIKIERVEINLEKTLEDQKIVITNFQNFQFLQNEIYNALRSEFSYDLQRWQAELTREDLAIRFFAPDVLFDAGASKLSKKFELILTDFMPRYVKVLKTYDHAISEIRIEGHTSSEHSRGKDALDRYVQNLKLSQDRAREVAIFSLQNLERNDERWLRKSLTSNGLSSSRLIMDANENESKEKSRRVEFKVITDVGSTMRALSELTNKNEN